MKTPERREWRHSGVFIVNFEYIFTSCSSVSIIKFDHIIAGSILIRSVISGKKV